ncbi:hypothetical protein [Flavobacterium sp.]|uniref:hypothetical protein n=1 Tax=Flavobacterium sp. TaxID=239 RepID=UPI0022BE6F3D|nr:hypothetical protein [Flavobacterium sp.]MCZ8091204.1 hypothetical protein [Flavobacterium sp.]
MAEIKDFLHKPITTSKINFWSTFKNNLELIYHSLLPHAFPVEPNSKITKKSIKKRDIDLVYESSIEIYKDSKERINSLENKAFNLMTYISAITALLIFLLDKELNTITKILAFTSILTLILALLISLRCIGIKTQKTLFINSMFEFNDNQLPKSKSKKHIAAELINNAIFNQNIADNTTDILKASRMLLFCGIILSLVTFLSFIIQNEERKIEPNKKIEIVNSKYIDSLFLDYKKSKTLKSEKISNKTDTSNKKIEKVILLRKAEK